MNQRKECSLRLDERVTFDWIPIKSRLGRVKTVSSGSRTGYEGQRLRWGRNQMRNVWAPMSGHLLVWSQPRIWPTGMINHVQGHLCSSQTCPVSILWRSLITIALIFCQNNAIMNTFYFCVFDVNHNFCILGWFWNKFYLFRGKGKEGERKGEKYRFVRETSTVTPACPYLGTWPEAQACALTRNQTGKSFGPQASTQSTEPHQPGWHTFYFF